jgi:hypothetical protein
MRKLLVVILALKKLRSLVTLGGYQPQDNAIAGNIFTRDELTHGLSSPEAA